MSHPVITGAGKTTVRLEAHVEHAGKMLHRVRVENVGFLEERLRARHEPGVQVDMDQEVQKVRQREFVFYSDEPAFLGGDDEHPAPLEYFAAGIGT